VVEHLTAVPEIKGSSPDGAQGNVQNDEEKRLKLSRRFITFSIPI
jgi:hypothetical protein